MLRNLRNTVAQALLQVIEDDIYVDKMLYYYYNMFMKLSKEPEPTIYNRVKVLRVERGLSRKQLAEELGVNYQTVGYIERGEYNPSLELAFRASEFFALPIEAIFARTPFKPLSEEVYGSSSASDGTIEGNVIPRGGASR